MLRISVAETLAKSALTEDADLLEYPLKMFVATIIIIIIIIIIIVTTIIIIIMIIIIINLINVHRSKSCAIITQHYLYQSMLKMVF